MQMFSWLLCHIILSSEHLWAETISDKPLRSSVWEARKTLALECYIF